MYILLSCHHLQIWILWWSCEAGEGAWVPLPRSSLHSLPGRAFRGLCDSRVLLIGHGPVRRGRGRCQTEAPDWTRSVSPLHVIWWGAGRDRHHSNTPVYTHARIHVQKGFRRPSCVAVCSYLNVFSQAWVKFVWSGLLLRHILFSFKIINTFDTLLLSVTHSTNQLLSGKLNFLPPFFVFFL